MYLREQERTHLQKAKVGHPVLAARALVLAARALEEQKQIPRHLPA